jgi:hypothetical protein
MTPRVLDFYLTFFVRNGTWPGQRIGYIRVSRLDRNTQRQLEGVQLDRIFTDKASGKDTKRPQLDELLRFHP